MAVDELQSNTPLETIHPWIFVKMFCSVKWMNHVAVLINLLIYDESFRFDCLEFIMRVICLCELFGLQDSLEEEIYFNLNGTFLEKN